MKLIRDNIYGGLPGIIRTPVSFLWGNIPQSIKYGKTYRSYQHLLERSQWWTKEKHERYQVGKMREIVAYAKEHVPYYRKIFEDVGIGAHDIRGVEDIQKIPFTEKDIFISKGTAMLSDEYRMSDLLVKTTSGTSGKQLRMYTLPKAYEKREIPFVNTIWGRVGYVPGKSRVVRMRNEGFKEGSLWRYNYLTKELVIDTYHLTDMNIGRILDKMSKWKGEFLHIYPSTAMILCDYIQRRKIPYHSDLKAVLVTSENLYPGQKEIIEECMGARCFTFYGHSECAGIAGWCEESDLYHIQSEYGYMELIDEKGNVIQEPGKIGEIVCTGFDNYVMPFIRYRTEDYASYAEERFCSCGRHYKLLKRIEGRRTQEMFIGKDGNRIALTAINMHSDIFRNVKNYQFVQDIPGRCVLRVVRADGYSENDEEMIQREVTKKFGSSVEVSISYVAQIERQKSGKQKFFVQNIKG